MEKRYLREAVGMTDHGVKLFDIQSLEEDRFFTAVAAAIASCGPVPQLRVTITCREYRG